MKEICMFPPDIITKLFLLTLDSVAEERFRNFYGFRGARLSSNQSVRGATQEARTWLITLLSPILLCAPEGHIVVFRDLWIDSSLSARRWKAMMIKLEKDWEKQLICVRGKLLARTSDLMLYT